MASHIEPVLHVRKINRHGFDTIEAVPARLQSGPGCGRLLLGAKSIRDSPYLEGLQLRCFISDIDGKVIPAGMGYVTHGLIDLGDAQRMAKTLRDGGKAFARHSVTDFGDQVRAMAAWLHCRQIVFLDENGGLDVTDVAAGVHKVRRLLRKLEEEKKTALRIHAA